MSKGKIDVVSDGPYRLVIDGEQTETEYRELKEAQQDATNALLADPAATVRIRQPDVRVEWQSRPSGPVPEE
jgi:hypothetical protein